MVGGTITLGIVLKGHSIAKVENNCPVVFIVIKVPRALWQCLHFTHEESFEPVCLSRSSVSLQCLPEQVFSCRLALSRLCICEALIAISKQFFELNA